jgi:hypothetical protein
MFFLRTTSMPSIQKILELERIIVIDQAGNNIPVSAATGYGCLVAEFVAGPFTPQVINNPGDITNLYMQDQSKISLLSQGDFVSPTVSGGPTADDNNGTGVAFDGNGWAELKGKTFTGLVIQRVDSDMIVVGDGSSNAKAYISFTISVAANDLNTGATATNKDLVIPAGTRFANNTSASTATVIIATSQTLTIPAGTPCTGTLTVAISCTQDVSTGQLTYVTTGATLGVTCFFVLGWNDGGGPVHDCLDVAIPGADPATTIAATGNSTINGSASSTSIYAPSGGGAQGGSNANTLSDCIALCYPPAIQKTLPGQPNTDNIIAIWAARNYKGTAANIKAIRTALWSANSIVASASGRGRIACVTASPALSASFTDRQTAVNGYLALVHTTDAVTDPDSDRYWACGPYQMVNSTELNRDIMISACGFRVAMKVNRFNAGQSQYLTSAPDDQQWIQGIDAQEPAFAAYPLQDSPTGYSEYVAMKAAGVAWLVKDRTVGWWFYSGVTGINPTGAYANRVDDNRRSFADEIQDVIFGLASYYAKLPGTTDRQDAFAGSVRAYTDQLVNPGPGIEQRALADQVLDGAAAGNTQQLNAEGIFFYSVSVQMVGSQKSIVITTQVGTNVVITQTA